MSDITLFAQACSDFRSTRYSTVAGWALFATLAASAVACSDSADPPPAVQGTAAQGGATLTGGNGGMAPSGGTPNTGGTATSGGASTTGSGGSSGGASGGAFAGGAGGSGGGVGGGGSGGVGGGAAVADTFQVKGRYLYDSCGEKVVLRGVNEMIVWSPGKDGVPEFAEIAKTGANVVRIVWNGEGSAAELDTAITNAYGEKLIPMIEHHGATGDLSLLPGVVDYWTQADVVAVLKKHSRYLLLNIANEAGATVQAAAFEAAYKTAITRIRATGVAMPLIIDGPQWGQDIDMLQATGPGLLAHDPLKNVLFSVHMWWSDATGDRVKRELAESVALELPLIVGEFAQHAVYQCSKSPFAYKVLLAEAQKLEIGWLSWSWGGVVNNDCKDDGSFDMTNGGTFGSWKEVWGEEVAVSDPNSIKNTSVRPTSVTLGTCNK